MEKFLKIHEHEAISYHFKTNGLSDDNFFKDKDKVITLAKDYDKFADFPRDDENENFLVKIEENENLAEPIDAHENAFNNQHNSNDHSPEHSEKVENTSELNESSKKKFIPEGEFDKFFVNNDSFFVFNKTLEGKIVLGRYLNSEIIDLSSIKNILLLDEFKPGHSDLKLDEPDFTRISRQLKELMPEVDEDYLYSPFQVDDKTGKKSGPKGLLYEHYKELRKRLREAGIIKDAGFCKKTHRKYNQEGIEEELEVLNDKDQSKFTFAQILSKWEETCELRLKKLIKNAKTGENPITVDKYFLSFPCLKDTTHAVALLESDFKFIVKILPDSKKLAEHEDSFCDNAFSKWPGFAKIIIDLVKCSSQTLVKQFYQDNRDLCSQESLTNIAALLALSSLINVSKAIDSAHNEHVDNKNVADNKQVKRGQKRKRNLDISEDNSNDLDKESIQSKIAQSFILYVRQQQNLQNEKKEYESFLDKYQLQHYPYIILSGDLIDTVNVNLVVNRELFSCTGIIEAVEKCFKCSIALQGWSYLCEHIWYFIQKKIYDWKPSNSVMPYNALCMKLNKKLAKSVKTVSVDQKSDESVKTIPTIPK